MTQRGAAGRLRSPFRGLGAVLSLIQAEHAAGDQLQHHHLPFVARHGLPAGPPDGPQASVLNLAYVFLQSGLSLSNPNYGEPVIPLIRVVIINPN